MRTFKDKNGREVITMNDPKKKKVKKTLDEEMITTGNIEKIQKLRAKEKAEEEKENE